MATYTIVTSRKQEVGLKFMYDTYADKLLYPTQEKYLQAMVNIQVTDPMYTQQQQAQLVSFDQSFNTVPEAEQPVAKVEIEGVITSHGGTIVTPGTPAPTPQIVPQKEEEDNERK